MTKIALIIGSLSRASINRTVAQHLAAQAPEGVVVEEVQIGDLPLYTQDLDSESIPAYERLLDIASRPAGKSLWGGKKTAVVTASPGSYGGINSGLHIRQSLQAMSADVMIAPEVFLSRAHTALADGQVSDARTAAFLNKFAAAFYAWAQAE